MVNFTKNDVINNVVFPSLLLCMFGIYILIKFDMFVPLLSGVSGVITGIFLTRKINSKNNK